MCLSLYTRRCLSTLTATLHPHDCSPRCLVLEEREIPKGHKRSHLPLRFQSVSTLKTITDVFEYFPDWEATLQVLCQKFQITGAYPC